MSAEKIRELNDRLRQSLSGGKIMITQGVKALSEADKQILLNKVRTFDLFTKDNDPYGEHDFGCVNFKGEQFFWKIDYYDVDYQYVSLDAGDETITNRVLTIMRAEEY